MYKRQDDEDTLSFDDEDGELSVVEVNEQMNVDSIWITIAQYYAIWDSRTINPYKIDGANFKDTISIMLYDSTVGFRWSMPLEFSKIHSKFGMRHYRWHYGTDLGLEIGDPVMSVFDGIVRIVKYDARGYGRYVLVRHVNGLETLYGHLSATNVSAGQLVKAGEIIGKGGSSGRSSGPHLHFEVWGETFYDPVDPWPGTCNRWACSARHWLAWRSSVRRNWSWPCWRSGKQAALTFPSTRPILVRVWNCWSPTAAYAGWSSG